MADGTNTRRDLVERALEELGATAAGQAPAPEDVEIVDRHIEPLFASLVARGFSDTLVADSIPDETLLPLSMMLAFACRGKFGVAAGSIDDPTSFAGRNFAAERDLRAMLAVAPTYGAQVAEYF